MFEKFDDILTVVELCKALNIGKNYAYDYLKKGIIKSIKIGNKYLIPKEFLIEFIRSIK